MREALSASAENASLHHALGLALVRLKRNDAALDELRQAASLDPGQARYAYVYAVGLHSSGRRDDALAVLGNGLQLHPNDREMLSAALALSREKGDSVSALEYAERLSRLMPGNREIEALIKQISDRDRRPIAPEPPIVRIFRHFPKPVIGCLIIRGADSGNRDDAPS